MGTENKVLKFFSPTNTQFGIHGTICLPFLYGQGTTLGQYLFPFQFFAILIRLDLQPVLVFSLVSVAAFLFYIVETTRWAASVPCA